MKNIDTTNFLLSTRQIAARLTFTDYRLRFTDLGDTDNPADWIHYDASEYGTGIIQVRMKAGDPATTIYWRYISDLNGTWPGWTTATVPATTDVALSGATLFTSGKIYPSIFDLTTSTTVPSYAHALLAPVSATEFYCLSYAAGLCSLYNINSAGTVVHFPGGIYENTQPAYFDAARIGTKDYIYFVKDGGKKTYFLTHQLSGTYHSWGAITPLIPMDVVDDISQARLSSVNIINNKLMVSAVLMRSSGLGMHMYAVGADSYTLGRDLFIGTSNLTGRGKLFLIGSQVWYIGPGVKFSAPATQFVGYSNSAMEFQISETISINMPITKNDAPNTQVTLRSNVTHAAVCAGAKCKLEVASNGVYVHLGTFGVDAVMNASDDTSRGITISMRSLGMKEISNWESDAPYDYWSQTKVNTNPKDMTEVVRTSASWVQEANGLTTYDLNTNGFLYVAENSCINGIIEGRFTRSTGDTYSRFGVGLHYTVETPLDTATRLGMQEADVTEDLLGHSGTFAVAGMKENAGSQGVGVYLVNNNVWTQIAHWSLVIGTTPYWLRMQYIDGYIVVHARAVSSTTWVKLGSVVNATVPYSSDYSSRGAIFMENFTGGSTCPLMDDKITFVPVLDNSSFPAEDTVKIDDEFIHYSSKSLNNRQSLKEYWRNSGSLPSLNGTVNNATFDLIPIGKDNTSTAIKVPVSSAWASPNHYGTIYFIQIAKVGNPTDSLFISATSGTPVATVTVKPELIASAPCDLNPNNFPQLLVFIKPHIMDAINNGGGEYTPPYLTIRRNIQTTYDANNYYVVLGASIPAVTADKYWTLKYNTATSVWEKPISGKNTSVIVFFCQDGDTSTGSAVTFPFVIKNSFFAGNFVSQPSAVGLAAILPGDLICTVKTDAYSVIDSLTSRIITMNESYGYHCTLSNAGITYISPRANYNLNIVEIYPVLQGAIRGFNNTTVAPHKNAKIDVYRAGPFAHIDALHYWSGDMDMSLDDMIREIATKTGYPNMTSNLLLPASLIPSGSNPVINSRNFVLKMILSAAPTGTIVVEGRRDVGASRVKIELSNTSLKYYSGVTLRQQYDLPFPGIFGSITVSFFEEHVSVWMNGTLLHSFVLESDDAAYTGTYMTVSGTENLSIGVYLPEGNIRVDNYILDNNKTAISLIDNLIGNKMFWFFDSNDQIKIVQAATTVNTALTPYNLTIINNHSYSDMGVATRIRVEGAEVSEVIDTDMMAKYGNLYHYINIPEINSQGDADYYAALNLSDAGSRYEIYSLQGAADPKIEPQDVIYVGLPEGVKKVLVDEINFMIDIQSGGGPVFDMMINGRVLRSDLT
ncbi:MAG: hypothetical protein ABSE06_12485 [Anaerolineaceae bacterium]|jgi:hypothetical protein